MRKPFYQPERYYTPRAERKWISRYTLEGEELQNLVSQNQSVLYTEILDLSVAQSFFNPKILNVPGRAIALYGIQSGTEYNPKTNSGIETVASDPFVFIRLNHQDLSNGYALKHTRGLRCDFSQSFLSWPAQSGVKARLVIYKFDQHPWQTGVSSWPNGADGALVITLGQTIVLPVGTVKNYSSVRIDAGGQLIVDNSGLGSGTPIAIGCAGNFTLNGNLEFRLNKDDGTFSQTFPDGFTLSYTVARNLGGDGGANGGATGAGGAHFSYNGGGGGGFTGGGNATILVAGNGGDGDDQGGQFTGANGGQGIGQNGDDGIGGFGSIGASGYGDGSGGGCGGFNGGGIYIKVLGNCAGTGSVSVAGVGGGSGGAGGPFDGNGATPNGFGGGGGGGGSGGSGGKIVVKYHGVAPLWTLIASGGVKGVGGAGGVSSNSTIQDIDGDPGSDGQVGNAGTTSLTAF